MCLWWNSPLGTMAFKLTTGLMFIPQMQANNHPVSVGEKWTRQLTTILTFQIELPLTSIDIYSHQDAGLSTISHTELLIGMLLVSRFILVEENAVECSNIIMFYCTLFYVYFKSFQEKYYCGSIPVSFSHLHAAG